MITTATLSQSSLCQRNRKQIPHSKVFITSALSFTKVRHACFTETNNASKSLASCRYTEGGEIPAMVWHLHDGNMETIQVRTIETNELLTDENSDTFLLHPRLLSHSDHFSKVQSGAQHSDNDLGNLIVILNF